MLQGKNILFARFVSSQIHDDWRVFYAQMTSCALHYDVMYHPSPINSHYLNTWGVDSPAFGKKRIKSYTNSPFSSCQANQPTNLYQSKAWCTTIHSNMSFINLCSEWNVFSFFFFHMKERVPGVALIRSLKANGNRKRTIVDHGRLPDWEAYCTGSESNSNSDVRALVTWLLDVSD